MVIALVLTPILNMLIAIDIAYRNCIMRHSRDTFSRAYINRSTNFDAKIDQQTGPYAIKKLSETLEYMGVSVRNNIEISGAVTLTGTAPPLVSEAQWLGICVPKATLCASESAGVPQVAIEKGLEAPGNARPGKRRWEKEPDLIT